MGDAAGDDEDFAGFDGVEIAVAEVEHHGALEDEGDLLVVVGVSGYDAAFGEDDAGEHALGAGDELTLEEGVELFDLDFGPAVEGGGGRGGHVVANLSVVCLRNVNFSLCVARSLV